MKGSAGFCCQVPANPASYLLQQEGFISGDRAALRSESNLSIVVVGNYKDGPMSAGTIPSESNTLYALVDPISPP